MRWTSGSPVGGLLPAGEDAAEAGELPADGSLLLPPKPAAPLAAA